MVYKILKVLLLLALIAGIGFMLLNFSYFSQQLGYFFDRVFVSEVQRDFRRQEKNIQQQPNELYIPSLEIRAPIIYTEVTDETGFQLALQNGVVHYPGTARIGEAGNTYIFGHSSDFAFAKGDYKTVFALLPHIELGAEILLADERGEIYKYIVNEKFVAEKTDTHLLKQDTNFRKILTLQTSYPVGTALRRYIVKAELKPE